MILTLLAGSYNYGGNTIDKNGKKTVFASLVNGLTKNKNMPDINIMWAKSTSVHEIAHSFCNPLMDKHMDIIEPYTEAILKIWKM